MFPATKDDLGILRKEFIKFRCEIKASLAEMKTSLIRWMAFFAVLQTVSVATLFKLLKSLPADGRTRETVAALVKARARLVNTSGTRGRGNVGEISNLAREEGRRRGDGAEQMPSEL